MKRIIDKEKMLSNIKDMISTLEYDASRSPGKSKMNAQNLYYLYKLVEIYSKKPTTKKEVV
jgi:hypothetical protein